jgi:hypothetical protein
MSGNRQNKRRERALSHRREMTSRSNQSVVGIVSCRAHPAHAAIQQSQFQRAVKPRKTLDVSTDPTWKIDARPPRSIEQLVSVRLETIPPRPQNLPL